MQAYLSTALLGAFLGSIYALGALGLVLTYRTSGVLNFAQGALGMLFAFVFFQLVQGGRGNEQLHFVVANYHPSWHIPRYVALVLTVGVLAPGLGMLLDTVLFRKLRQAGSVVRIVATIGLLLSFEGLVSVVWTSGTTLSPRSIFPTRILTLSGIHAGENQVITLLLVVALCAGLIAFLRFSPIGIRMRAVVDRPEVAELMGVNANRVSTVAWGIATGFAALAGILIAPFYGTLDIITLTFLVVTAIATAVLGKLSSLPLTLAAGIGIGILQLFTQRYAPHSISTQLESSIPFLVLFVALLLPIRWPTDAAPTAPAKPLAIDRAPAKARIRRTAILATVLVLAPFLLTPVLNKVLGTLWQAQIAVVPALAIVFLSLVVLTGYAGQISLCQAGLAGFGAFACAHLVVDHGVPFLLAAPLAGLLAVPLGAVLASRATRLPPLFLGLATLAFGAFLDEVVFSSRSFSNGQVGILIHRPTLLVSSRAYYLAGLAAFGLCALLATNLRRGRTGLALAAMRDSPAGLSSLGQSLARAKLLIFCLSAFLAGLGGAMLAGAAGRAISVDYFRVFSLIVLALAVVGGISRWPGALLGATLYTLPPAIFGQPFVTHNVVLKAVFHGQLANLLPVFFGLGAIGLAQNPHGVIEQNREGFAKFRARRSSRRASQPTPLLESLAATPMPVFFPNARSYHLDSCVLTVGKEAKALTAARARRLQPCEICNPPAPPAPDRATADGRAATRSPSRPRTRPEPEG